MSGDDVVPFEFSAPPKVNDQRPSFTSGLPSVTLAEAIKMLKDATEQYDLANLREIHEELFPDAQRFLSENERHTILLPDPPVTVNAILIEDRPDITAEAHVITEPLMMERANSSPCRPSATDHGYRSCSHDQASAKEYGSAEHHNISSTKAGLREKDMHLSNDKSAFEDWCRKPRVRTGTGVPLRQALPCPDAYDRPPGPGLTTADAVPDPQALSSA